MQREKDVEMLAALAELRVATGAQLAAWLGVLERVGRRRAVRMAASEVPPGRVTADPFD